MFTLFDNEVINKEEKTIDTRNIHSEEAENSVARNKPNIVFGGLPSTRGRG